MTHNRQHAINILDMFEDVLDKHNLYIPDDDRTGSLDEACIFGTTYGNLEDEISYYLDSVSESKKSQKTSEQQMLINMINAYVDVTSGMEGDFEAITEEIVATTDMTEEYFYSIKDDLDYVAVAPQYEATDIVWRHNFSSTPPPDKIPIPFGLTEREITEYINDYGDAFCTEYTLTEIDYDAIIKLIFSEV